MTLLSNYDILMIVRWIQKDCYQIYSRFCMNSSDRAHNLLEYELHEIGPLGLQCRGNRMPEHYITGRRTDALFCELLGSIGEIYIQNIIRASARNS